MQVRWVSPISYMNTHMPHAIPVTFHLNTKPVLERTPLAILNT